MNGESLNLCLSQVCNCSGQRYLARTLYRLVCGIKCYLSDIDGFENSCSYKNMWLYTSLQPLEVVYNSFNYCINSFTNPSFSLRLFQTLPVLSDSWTLSLFTDRACDLNSAFLLAVTLMNYYWILQVLRWNVVIDYWQRRWPRNKLSVCSKDLTRLDDHIPSEYVTPWSGTIFFFTISIKETLTVFHFSIHSLVWMLGDHWKLPQQLLI